MRNLITEFILIKVHNMTIQARDVLLNSAHATVFPTLVVCYHAHCSISYMGCFLMRMVLKVEHGREREVEDGRWQIKRGEMEKVSTLMA